MAAGYDALVVVSFGGPEGPEDVEPFLDNVLRGRPVAQARRDAVAAHYQLFGGRSPINDHNRVLVAAVRADLDAHGLDLPVYWGNRNWDPLLAGTVRLMRDDGVRRALAFVTSAYASYSGCHQYLDDISAARRIVGPEAPEIDKLRVFYNHPGFVEANADALRSALVVAGPSARIVFTAHSIPAAMAATCDYQSQLTETARMVVSLAVARAAPATDAPATDAPATDAPATDAPAPVPGGRWDLVFQSRSGPPSVPWLGPDVNDHLAALAANSLDPVVVAPIGFVADHMEVVYDLDIEAKKTADRLGLPMVRAATAGVHPAFVAMVRQLVEERLDGSAPKLALGPDGPYHDVCRPQCCPPPAGRPAR